MTQSINIPAPTAKTPILYKIAVMLGMMSLMGATLTCVMTYLNIGYTADFFSRWLSTFLMAVLLLMPIGMMTMALLTKVASVLFPNSNEKLKNIVIGIIMACVMESIMAFVTAANNIGFADMASFQAAWLKGLLGALPVAMVLMITISLTIKPKVERFLKS